VEVRSAPDGMEGRLKFDEDGRVYSLKPSSYQVILLYGCCSYCLYSGGWVTLSHQPLERS
jgi:hypothetical protein